MESCMQATQQIRRKAVVMEAWDGASALDRSKCWKEERKIILCKDGVLVAEQCGRTDWPIKCVKNAAGGLYLAFGKEESESALLCCDLCKTQTTYYGSDAPSGKYYCLKGDDKRAFRKGSDGMESSNTAVTLEPADQANCADKPEWPYDSR